MIVTTTNQIEGKQIIEYCDIVFGEAVAGVNMFRDIGASFRNVFGGRSRGYENEMMQARTEVIEEMKKRAAAVGATDIVGVKFDYDMANEMLMVMCSGTAVIAENK
ncbi:YbjQ family protein [Holzapfeliella sp. JNUCC 72]